MSSAADDKPLTVGGIFKSAVNKIKYKASEAATDPAANEAAKKAEEKIDWVQFDSLSPDTQVLLKQIYKNFGNYYKNILAVINKDNLDKLSSEQKNSLLEKFVKEMVDIGFNPLTGTIKKGTTVNRSFYNKLINSVKNVALTFYAIAMPSSISLPDFKKFLKDNAPAYPGETGPGGIDMPSVSRTAVQSFKKSFMDTITGKAVVNIIIFLVCTFIGMLAANDAIGRSGFIRFIYFIYASIPIFAPFAGVYYIYRYIKGTFPKIYAYLPLVQVIGEQGKIAGFLLAPFSYFPDLVPGTNKQVMTEIYDTVASGFVFKGTQPEAKADVPSAN